LPIFSGCVIRDVAPLNYKQNVTIQTKDFEEYFSVGLFIMFYKVDATFVSGKRNLQCELESY